jgi:hypothetical protein
LTWRVVVGAVHGPVHCQKAASNQGESSSAPPEDPSEPPPHKEKRSYSYVYRQPARYTFRGLFKELAGGDTAVVGDLGSDLGKNERKRAPIGKASEDCCAAQKGGTQG